MSIRFAFPTLVVLAAFAAHAEPLVTGSTAPPNDEKLVLSLPRGPVEITMDEPNGDGLTVRAGAADEIKINSADMPSLLKTYHDSALLEVSTGGNACPTLFVWVTFDARGLRASKDFGTCAEEADYEETTKGPLVSMDDIQSPGRVVSYLYDPATNHLTQSRK